MKFYPTNLQGVYKIELEPFKDNRGMFARTFCKRDFTQIGHQNEFVQFNFSKTDVKGTIRGLHYQASPFSEIKLIRCIKGAVYDVVVDLREESSTFLKYAGLELSEDNLTMIYIPEGFAHGFQTLTDDAQLIYHHTAYYNIEYERGIRYNDPAVGIEWPLDITLVSEKDKNYPFFTVHDSKEKI